MHRKKRISRNCGGCVGLAENYVVFCRQFEIREKESVHVVAVTDISKLRRKLIGISYLGEEENTRLKAVWDERFEESDAFFINAECSENIPAILKRLFDAIRDMGYNDMAGSDFVVAGFYDLTTDVEYEADLSTLKLNLIGAEVVGFAGFAYLGRQPYQDPDMIRSRAQKLAETGNGSLCLVATHPLAKDSTDGWRAVCLMLDIARRSGQLVDVFPDTRYNVGFLRYAEYDDEFPQVGTYVNDGRFLNLTELLAQLYKSVDDANQAEPVEGAVSWYDKLRYIASAQDDISQIVGQEYAAGTPLAAIVFEDNTVLVFSEADEAARSYYQSNASKVMASSAADQIVACMVASPAADGQQAQAVNID